MKRLPCRGNSRGFSLLEVIVALAIMGICVTVILRIFAGVASSTRLADDYYQALQVAETQLALLTADESPVGFHSGKAGDYFHWQARVEEYKQDLNNPLFSNSSIVDPENQHIPYHYQVTVSWGLRKKRQLELSTVRLGLTD